jgi:hypothetical protein
LTALNNFFSFSESSASGFASYYCTTLHPRSEESAILIIIKEADNVLDANKPSQEGISKAKEKLAEGMSLLNYRQKIIKIADSSDLGWRVVQVLIFSLFLRSGHSCFQ